MDNSTEEYFIKTFIRKSRQERLFHELTNEKKRYRGIDRFCHQASGLIDLSKVVMKDDDLVSGNAFEKFIEKHEQDCYVLSTDSFLNERMISLQEAVDQANMSTEAVLIIGKGFAIVFGEAMKKGRDRFLLAEEK
ncbi:MAG: hypothetical protein IJH00_03060 [Erysipelotrichaceae bacterium]|nr:hypothetical protein [Erysipelotrichaceae bacterium]